MDTLQIGFIRLESKVWPCSRPHPFFSSIIKIQDATTITLAFGLVWPVPRRGVTLVMLVRLPRKILLLKIHA